MRREVHPILYEDDPDFIEAWPDAQITRGVRKTYTHPDQMGMLREGFMCVRCDELQPDSFPEACGVCGFPMREEQSRYFEDRFEGERIIGSSISWEAEMERLERQRWERERAEGLRAKGIYVPRGLKS